MPTLKGSLLLLLLAAAPGRGADFSQSAIGTTGSEFLNIGVDPRGMAMGGAYTAVTNDAYSMSWNPAGLAMIPRLSMGFTHAEYLAGIRLEYFTGAVRITDTSVIAQSQRYIDYGEITSRDISGNDTGDFRPWAYVQELGWGQSITDMTDAERDISLGVIVRHIYSDMGGNYSPKEGDTGNSVAEGYAGDLGIQAHFTEAYIPYNFGVVIQNMGSGQKFDQVRDSLPFMARLGAAIRPKPALLLSLDGSFPSSNMPFASLGAEVTLETQKRLKLFLRAGYNSRNQFSGLDGLRGFTLGTGATGGNFSFDYAFIPFGVLGDTHRFSVSWNLPPKQSRRYRQR